MNNALTAKASQSTTYTKIEVHNALSAKANQSSTYTKTEVDNVVSLGQDPLTVGDPVKSNRCTECDGLSNPDR